MKLFASLLILLSPRDSSAEKSLSVSKEVNYITNGAILFVARCQLDIDPDVPLPDRVVFSNTGMEFTFTALTDSTESSCGSQVTGTPIGDLAAVAENPTGEFEAGISEEAYNMDRYMFGCRFNRFNKLNRVLLVKTTNPSFWDYQNWTCVSEVNNVTEENDLNIFAKEFLETNELRLLTPKADFITVNGKKSVNFDLGYEMSVALGDGGSIDTDFIQDQYDINDKIINKSPSLLRLKISSPQYEKPMEINTEMYNRMVSYNLEGTAVAGQCEFSTPDNRVNEVTGNIFFTRASENEAGGEFISLKDFEMNYCFGGRDLKNQAGTSPNLFMTNSECVTYSAIVSEYTYNLNPQIYKEGEVFLLDKTLFHPKKVIQNHPHGLIQDVKLSSNKLLFESPAYGSVQAVELGAYIMRINFVGGVQHPEVGDVYGKVELHSKSLPDRFIINDFYSKIMEAVKEYKRVKVLEVSAHDYRYATEFPLTGCYNPDSTDQVYKIIAIMSDDCVFADTTAASTCKNGDAYKVKEFDTTTPRLEKISAVKQKAHGSFPYPPNSWFYKAGLPCMYKYVYCFSETRGYKTALRSVMVTTRNEYDDRPHALDNKYLPSGTLMSTQCPSGQGSNADNAVSQNYPITTKWMEGYHNDNNYKDYNNVQSIPYFISSAIKTYVFRGEMFVFMKQSVIQDTRITCPCSKVLNTCPENNPNSVANIRMSDSIKELYNLMQDPEARVWAELQGFRSQKKRTDEILVNYVCHLVENRRLDEYPYLGDSYTFIYHAKHDMHIEDISQLLQFLPEPTFTVEKGIGEKNDRYYLTIGQVPTLCKHTWEFSSGITITWEDKETDEILGLHFFIQRVSNLTGNVITENATEVILNGELKEEYSGALKEPFTEVVGDDGYSSVSYQLLISDIPHGGDLSKLKINIYTQYGTLALKKGKDYDDAASKALLSEAKTVCTEEDYDFSLERSAEKTFVMKSNWTVGCTPPTSGMYIVLDEHPTGFSIRCDHLGYAFVSNKYYVSKDAVEQVIPQDYLKNRASFCSPAENEKQTLTLITDISDDYIGGVTVKGLLQTNAREIFIEKEKEYADLEVDCHDVPRTFRPQIGKNANVEPQKLHIDCTVPRHLTHGRLCNDPTGTFNLTLNFQYHILGDINSVRVKGYVNENGTCQIVSGSENLASCVNLGEGGIKYILKDSFFQSIVELYHTIRMLATCTIDDFMPSNPMTISVVEDITRSVVKLRDGLDAKNITMEREPANVDLEVLHTIIIFVGGMVAAGLLSIFIAVCINWRNKYKTARLLQNRHENYSYTPGII
uniref:Uncharacterized protein n=1 Tax=Abalone herpesvirus Taiwan/2005 TaxID=1821058 RepID=A0A143DH29_9VIRU|nr:hypothetical protein tc2005_p088c [Abalone herpesvirus Taiwan/2005]